MTLSTYQAQFIDFLIASNALSFGEFKLKSGRTAPYFINTGSFDDGQKIHALGKIYAAHIKANNLHHATIIFGPAYKGIPLCVTTVIGLQSEFGISTGFTFDRKEVKDHGDGGLLVGKKIKDGDNIVIVEDVVTAGTTLQKIIPLVTSLAKVNIIGVVVSVDRMERGNGTLTAVKEVEATLGVKVFPIVTIDHIVNYLSSKNSSGFVLNKSQIELISSYAKEYRA